MWGRVRPANLGPITTALLSDDYEPMPYWWDGVELWLSGLGFVFQSIVVMPVVLALAYVIAAAVDAALGRGIGLLNRLRHRDEEPG